VKLTKEQYRILDSLDVDAALKSVAARRFIPDNRQIALAGIHKARLATRRVWSRAKLDESRRWLLENGFKLDGPLAGRAATKDGERA
jgi:hypothetical protein